MWDCIDCSGFGVADQRRQFNSFQFQITQLFSTTEVNFSHVIVQINYTFNWISNKMGIFRFFILYQYCTLPLTRMQNYAPLFPCLKDHKSSCDFHTFVSLTMTLNRFVIYLLQETITDDLSINICF